MSETKQKDPRSTALRRFGLSITALTILGHTVLGFEQAYVAPVLTVLTALGAEFLLETVEARARGNRARYRTGSIGGAVDFFLPAYITGLACAMLLYDNGRFVPSMCAVVVAISSKYVVRIPVKGRLRHFMNPSNLGIAAVLLLFPEVGIAPPYEFTEWLRGPLDIALPVLILVLGTMLNAGLTKKMPLILAWVGGFALQALIRAPFDDISLISALFPLTSAAFVLFTNYMITDPGTTPFRPRNQVVFGLATAAMYGILVQFHIVFGLFFALVLTCVLRGIVLAAVELRTKVRAARSAKAAERAPDAAPSPVPMEGAVT